MELRHYGPLLFGAITADRRMTPRLFEKPQDPLTL